MPDNMINTVGGVMDDISKFLGNPKKNNAFESVKVGAGLDTEVLMRLFFFIFSVYSIILLSFYRLMTIYR